MSIKDLVFDNKTSEMVGFGYMQQWGENGVCQPIASHVLVFYVVGINSSLKASLGFFGTHTATADTIYLKFWQAVGFLEQTCKLKVIASTSDKASPNQRFYQLHGAQGEVCYKYINLFAPDRHIYFFSDPPHLIKTVNMLKSALGKTKFLWNNGSHILWSHIRQVYDDDGHSQLPRTQLTYTPQTEHS